MRKILETPDANNEIYINPEFALSSLQKNLLYYPFSGRDWEIPIRLFRDFINEFWFVDSGYSFTEDNLNFYSGGIFDEMILKNTLFIGTREKRDVETRLTEKGEEYKYLHPGIMVRTYQYKDREITIKFRRGYDYTSLFGPSELEIAESRLGIFFLRGTGSEGGSNHLWFNNNKMKMLRGHKKVSLLKKLVETLPNHGLIISDGSFGGLRPTKQKDAYFNPYSQSDMPLMKVLNKTEPFSDSKGNTFTCIGYAGEKYGPTMIWQVEKAKENQNSQ